MGSIGSPNPKVINTQIAIVGGGGAGLAAAVTAAEKGAEVLIIEKRPKIGGNSAFAEGLFAAESSAQKKINIDATADEMFKMAMDYAHYRLDGKLVRAFIKKSGDTIHWLEDKGLHFDYIPGYYPNQRIPTWHYVKGRGIVLLNILLEECETSGVKILVDTRGSELLVNKQHEVVGVTGIHNKQRFTVKAKCVIIATGGYGGNAGMLQKYVPFYSKNLVYKGLPHTGDGITMAVNAGASTEGLGILQLSGINSPELTESLNAIVEQPDTVWVNSLGERYIDETVGFNHFESVNAAVRQPDSISYTLFDRRQVRNYVETGIAKGLGQIIPPGTKLIELENELKRALSEHSEWITKSNSWDSIAKWMGTMPANLKMTVEEYNASCERGYDQVFAKDKKYLSPLKFPPYYAVKCYPSFLSTIGGIKINYQMQVLDKTGNPISGLFAAGSDTGGWEPETYNANLSGSAFGFAINSGRIAGENAVSFVLGP